MDKSFRSLLAYVAFLGGSLLAGCGGSTNANVAEGLRGAVYASLTAGGVTASKATALTDAGRTRATSAVAFRKLVDSNDGFHHRVSHPHTKNKNLNLQEETDTRSDTQKEEAADALTIATSFMEGMLAECPNQGLTTEELATVAQDGPSFVFDAMLASDDVTFIASEQVIMAGDITEAAVENFDEAGVSADLVLEFSQQLTDSFFTQFDDWGLDPSDISQITGEMSAAIVGSWDEAGLSAEQITANVDDFSEYYVGSLDETGLDDAYIKLAIQETTTGILGSLDEAGIESADIAAIAADVTESMVAAFDEAGLSADESVDAMKFLSQSIDEVATDAGLTGADLTAFMEAVVDGSIAGLDESGIPSGSLDEAIGQMVEGMGDSMASLGMTEGDAASDASQFLLDAVDGALTDSAALGINYDSIEMALFSNLADGLEAGGCEASALAEVASDLASFDPDTYTPPDPDSFDWSVPEQDTTSTTASCDPTVEDPDSESYCH